MLSIFWSELGSPVEVPHLGGNLHRGISNVKRLDAANTALAVLQRRPKRLTPNSDRGDTPHAGDDNTARTLKAVKHSVDSASNCQGVDEAYHPAQRQTSKTRRPE